ncbi:MAG: bile acid:sodium symporter [Planctomycetota bacterium]
MKPAMSARAIQRHWFLACLVGALAAAMTWSDGLAPLLRWTTLRHGLVFTVMFLAGWTLPLAAVRRAIGRPAASLWAIAINTLLVPVIAMGVGWSLAPDWLSGLMVAAWMPCTLASAAVWTRRAGGDDSIALITTVVTNAMCVVVTPLGLAASGWFLWTVSARRPIGAAIVGSGGTASAPGFEATIDPMDQFTKLLLLVLLPLTLSQLCRVGLFGRFSTSSWADRHKSSISSLAQIGILCMVFLGGIASGQLINRTGIFDVARVVLTTSSIHGIALIVGVLVAIKTGCRRESQIAVGFAGSQKTLMVGLQIAMDAGVSVIPMIAYHISQLMIDTIVADRWLQKK